MRRMVQSNRFEFVAKEVRDLVLKVQESCSKSYLRKGCVKNMTQVQMVGYINLFLLIIYIQQSY